MPAQFVWLPSLLIERSRSVEVRCLGEFGQLPAPAFCIMLLDTLMSLETLLKQTQKCLIADFCITEHRFE